MIQRPCTNLSQRCNLTRRTLHVKQQVSEAVVHRLQFLKFRKLHRKISVFEPLGLQLYQKETLIQLFSCEIYKISKNTCFMEQLQWLLLRFNSCFQRSPQFSWKRYLLLRKSRSSYRRFSVKEGLQLY